MLKATTITKQPTNKQAKVVWTRNKRTKTWRACSWQRAWPPNGLQDSTCFPCVDAKAIAASVKLWAGHGTFHLNLKTRQIEQTSTEMFGERRMEAQQTTSCRAHPMLGARKHTCVMCKWEVTWWRRNHNSNCVMDINSTSTAYSQRPEHQRQIWA